MQLVNGKKGLGQAVPFLRTPWHLIQKINIRRLLLAHSLSHSALMSCCNRLKSDAYLVGLYNGVNQHTTSLLSWVIKVNPQFQ